MSCTRKIVDFAYTCSATNQRILQNLAILQGERYVGIIRRVISGATARQFTKVSIVQFISNKHNVLIFFIVRHNRQACLFQSSFAVEDDKYQNPFSLPKEITVQRLDCTCIFIHVKKKNRLSVLEARALLPWRITMIIITRFFVCFSVCI